MGLHVANATASYSGGSVAWVGHGGVGGDDPEPSGNSGGTPSQRAESELTPPVDRRSLIVEIWLVLALSLGADALYAVLSLWQSLSAPTPLRAQSAVINASVTPNHSLLDLAYQLAGIVVALVPVALVVYLLGRSGEGASSIGIDNHRLGREIKWGAALAAAVGGVGLGFYVIAYRAGISVQVVPSTLPAVWWRIPVLVLSAVQNGVLEEVVVCGYLLHRLGQIQWRQDKALLTSAVLRGTYHLYQGFGGFIANGAMGVLFGRLYQRQGRLIRLVLAHVLIDTGAFVGYVVLRGRVSWLP